MMCGCPSRYFHSPGCTYYIRPLPVMDPPPGKDPR